MALKAEKSDIQNTTQGQFTSYQKKCTFRAVTQHHLPTWIKKWRNKVRYTWIFYLIDKDPLILHWVGIGNIQPTPTIHHLVQIKLISTNLKYLTYDTKENKRKTTPPTPTPEKIRGSWYFFSRGGCPLWEIGKEVRGLFLLRAFIWRGGGALPPQICVTNLFRLIQKTGHACRVYMGVIGKFE